MKIVLARFSIRGVITELVVALALIIPASLFAIYMPPGDSLGDLPKVVIWAGVAILVIYESVVIRQLVLDRGNAIWLDRDHIVYLHNWYLSIALKDIEAISVGSQGAIHRPVIKITMRNGRKRHVDAHLLTEPTETLSGRLQAYVAAM